MNGELTSNWSADERALLDQLRAGKTIVVPHTKRGSTMKSSSSPLLLRRSSPPWPKRAPASTRA